MVSLPAAVLATVLVHRVPYAGRIGTRIVRVVGGRRNDPKDPIRRARHRPSWHVKQTLVRLGGFVFKDVEMPFYEPRPRQPGVRSKCISGPMHRLE